MDLVNAAGYFRVSQAREEMSAPTIYRDEIERYCVYKHLRLVEVFSDIDYSGRPGSRPRPALTELIRRRNEFSVVVIPKLSRLGRSVKDLVNIFDLFGGDRIRLVFLDMSVDSSTSEGRLLRHIMMCLAEYDSAVKADYSRANYLLQAREGKPWGPYAPFGYVRDLSANTYRIDSEKARVVRDLYERYVAGESLSRLAGDLNARGIETPRNSYWRPATVRALIKRPAYAGLRQIGDEFLQGNWEPSCRDRCGRRRGLPKLTRREERRHVTLESGDIS